MDVTREHIDAIIAAINHIYPNLSEDELSREAGWLTEKVYLDKRGYLNWRTMEIGKLLFLSLSEAQNWRCCYCGERVQEESNKRGTLEHVVPKSRGGRDHPDNLVMACYVCNCAHNNQDILDL